MTAEAEGPAVTENPEGTTAGPWGPARHAWLLATAALALGVSAASGQREVPFEELFASPTVIRAQTLRGLRGEIASLILTAEPGGRIASEVVAVPLPASGGPTPVAVFVEIDGASFLDQNQTDRTRVELYVYALDKDGGVSDYMAEVFAVDITALGEAIWQKGLKHYGHLELPPGEYRLRTLVRNFHSGAGSLREVALTIPAAGRSATQAVAPSAGVRDPWLPVLEADRAWWRDGYPLIRHGRLIDPAARPVVVAEQERRLYLFGGELPRGESCGRIALERAGRTIAKAPCTVADRLSLPDPRGDGPPLSALEIAFTPPEAEAGEYDLKVELPEAGASEPLRSFVLSSGVRETDLLWTDLRWLLRPEASPAAPATAQAAPPTGGRHAGRRQVRRLAALYRQALSAGSDGSRSVGVGALLDLESQALTAGAQAAFSNLHAAQMQVAEDLVARGESRLLLPLIARHEELYRLYRERRTFSLMYHARITIESFAELLAAHGQAPDGPLLAAHALTSLGGYAQLGNLPSTSRRLFVRALELNPTDAAALIGLAASHEKYGEYQRAVGYLELLIEAHPEHAEGMLRLAINYQRLGRNGPAQELFRRLADRHGPPWIRSIALEELARGLVQQGAVEEAAAVIEAGLEATPGQPSLLMLLAHVYDRLRQPRRALELIETLGLVREVSPRRRYDSWPEPSLESSRRQLHDAAGRLSSALSAALGPAEEEAEG